MARLTQADKLPANGGITVSGRTGGLTRVSCRLAMLARSPTGVLVFLAKDERGKKEQKKERLIEKREGRVRKRGSASDRER